MEVWILRELDSPETLEFAKRFSTYLINLCTALVTCQRRKKGWRIKIVKNFAASLRSSVKFRGSCYSLTVKLTTGIAMTTRHRSCIISHHAACFTIVCSIRIEQQGRTKLLHISIVCRSCIYIHMCICGWSTTSPMGIIIVESSRLSTGECPQMMVIVIRAINCSSGYLFLRLYSQLLGLPLIIIRRNFYNNSCIIVQFLT